MIACALLLNSPARAQDETELAVAGRYVVEELTSSEAVSARERARTILSENAWLAGAVVLVELLNRTCPLRERIINYNADAAWNVVAKLELTNAYRSSSVGSFAGHVPYLPGRSAIQVTYACSMRGQLALDSMKSEVRLAGALSSEVISGWINGTPDWSTGRGGVLIPSAQPRLGGGAIQEVLGLVAAKQDFRKLVVATLGAPGGVSAVAHALRRQTGSALATKLDALDPPDLNALIAAANGKEGVELLGAYLASTGSAAAIDALVAALLKRKVPSATIVTALAGADRAVEPRAAALSRRLDALRKVKDPALPEIHAAMMERALGPDTPAPMAEALIVALPDGVAELEAAIRKAGGDGVLPLDAVLEKRKTIPALLEYWSDRRTLDKCFAGAEDAKRCAGRLSERYATEAASGLQPEATASLGALLARLSQDATTHGAAIDVYRAYQPFGASPEPVVAGICQAADAKALQGEVEEAKRLLDALRGLDAKRACSATVTLERQARQHSIDFLKSWILTISPLTLAMLWVAQSGRRLRRASKAGAAAGPDASSRGEMAQRIGEAAWKHASREVLNALARGSEGGGDGAKAAAGALDRAAAADARVVTKLADVARRAVESGEVASTLLGPGADPDADCVYLIAFPGAYDHPQALRRWPGFQQGWDAHVRCVEAAANASYPTAPGLSIVVVFVRPDATRGNACVDRRGKPRAFVPGALLDRAEFRANDDAEVGGEPVGFSVSSEQSRVERSAS